MMRKVCACIGDNRAKQVKEADGAAHTPAPVLPVVSSLQKKNVKSVGCFCLYLKFPFPLMANEWIHSFVQQIVYKAHNVCLV